MRAALASRSDWLLIIDNADHPDLIGDITELLPADPRGRVIITSRLTDWPGGYRRLPVPPLEAGADLLLTATPETRHMARALADDLDGLPFALIHAAGYRSQHHCTVDRYHEIFGTARAKRREDEHDEPGQATVATTVQVSIASIRDRDPAASAMLDLLSYSRRTPFPGPFS